MNVIKRMLKKVVSYFIETLVISNCVGNAEALVVTNKFCTTGLFHHRSQTDLKGRVYEKERYVLKRTQNFISNR